MIGARGFNVGLQCSIHLSFNNSHQVNSHSWISIIGFGKIDVAYNFIFFFLFD